MIDITWSVCPERNIINPCICSSDQFVCGGNQNIDLLKIFQTLGKNLTKTGKHFNSFQLSNSFMTELKENTFSDITFDVIYITENSNLKTIHKNAFNTTNFITDEIHLLLNPKLTSPDNSIFDAMSQFVRANYIDLYKNNITSIPSNAFRNIAGERRLIS